MPLFISCLLMGVAGWMAFPRKKVGVICLIAYAAGIIVGLSAR